MPSSSTSPRRAPRPRRPARAYVVSDAGHSALEADYDSLAVEVLRFLESTAAPTPSRDFARSRVATLEQRYAVRLAGAGPDPAARAAVLVEALSEDGFAATARPVGAGGLTGVQLCQGHCPVQHVVTELKDFLELTPAAVRRHLDVLVEQGAVEEHVPTAARRGRGRPARAYVVSDAGHSALEADYDSLAVEVLRFLETTAGPRAVADFARSRVATLEERYAVRLADAGTDPAVRTAALVEALSEDGFSATARPVGAGGLTGRPALPGPLPGAARRHRVPRLLRGRDRRLLAPARRARAAARHPRRRRPRVHDLRADRRPDG